MASEEQTRASGAEEQAVPHESAARQDEASDGEGLSRRGLVVLGIALLVVAGLFLPKLVPSSEGAADDEGGGEAPLGVDGYVVRAVDLTERVQTTGTLRANESVELTSEAAGKVTSIRFDEGSRVRRGQLLLTTNDAELQADRQRLEYRLRLAEDREQRQKRLLEMGGVSQEEYDATLNEVNVIQAELDLVEARIEKTKVRAPFNGTIGLRHVSDGSYISPQTPIASLQSIDPIKIDLSVPEKYAGRVEVGTPLSFTVRGSDETYAGTVYAIEPLIDAETRTLRLRAEAPNAEGRLRPGAFADVDVVLGTIEETLVVPTFAVIPELGGQRVFVAENGTVQPRNVVTGIRSDSTVQITEGLSLQDTVITSGIQNLRAGMPVQIEVTEQEVMQ